MYGFRNPSILKFNNLTKSKCNKVLTTFEKQFVVASFQKNCFQLVIQIFDKEVAFVVCYKIKIVFLTTAYTAINIASMKHLLKGGGGCKTEILWENISLKHSNILIFEKKYDNN